MVFRSKFFYLFLALLLGVYNFCLAHIGSPDIFYEGNAGPYKIEVMIQPPDVVPGVAKIFIRVLGKQVNKIKLQPVYFQYGSEGAPDADVAEKLKGTDGDFQGQLWLMAFGSASVKISLEGGAGSGSTIVPVAALASRTQGMDQGTTFVLIPLGLLLFAGLVTIIGVSTSQALVPPGQAVPVSKVKKSYLTMFVFGAFLLVGLYFAKTWWDAVEGKYKQYMFKPLSMKASIKEKEDGEELVLKLQNRPWLERKLTDMVPDHGKLMHLFLISDDANVFAHLHPVQKDSTEFFSSIPPLPIGRYAVFADVVHENGMPETLTDTLVISKKSESIAQLPADDAWLVASERNTTASADNLLKIELVGPDTMKRKIFSKLSFEVRDNNGQVAMLDPYLGMAGHVVVMKKDHAVFIHLHPMGTVSMASQAALAQKISGNVTLCNPLSDSLRLVTDSLGLADVNTLSLIGNNEQRTGLYSGKLNFPYAFPSSGDYWVWVQVKKNNMVFSQRFTVYVH